MRIQRKIAVSLTSEFIRMETGYLYDCKLFTSIDNGRTFYYCGYGKYCKTEAEAVDYVNGQMEKESVRIGFMTNSDSFLSEAFQFPCDKEKAC